MQLYEHLVCFVMAYSFTDSEEPDQCQRTMMVPFVDLLNHHSQHHVELRFRQDHLELVTVRRIRKAREQWQRAQPNPVHCLFSHVSPPLPPPPPSSLPATG